MYMCSSLYTFIVLMSDRIQMISPFLNSYQYRCLLQYECTNEVVSYSIYVLYMIVMKSKLIRKMFT